MTACPNCGKTVDPLRAPAVGVRAGKVVSYCSKECQTALESKPTPVAAATPAPATTVPKRPVTPATGVVMPAPALDSGPVIEIIREPTSGAVGAPVEVETTKSRPFRKRQDSSSVQIADTGHLDDYVTTDPRGRGLRVVLVVLFLVAGAVAGAYYLGYFDQLLGKRAATPAPADAATAGVEAVDAALAPVTAEEALDRAQTVLRTQMKSDSPRVQRVAASALARTKDKEAIELLAAALGQETGALAKVELAYMLARAADKRGFDALMTAAKTPGQDARDTRHEAGRRLALLGDKRAINVLAKSLDYAQFRLGVAEQLAYLAEPRALTVLDETRSDPKALPDEKARATIALGHAARRDVQPALRQLLDDDRNNAFAAVALAGLGDEAARPVLVKQLTIPSLRVQAARALRRLAPKADVSALLPGLVAALDSEKDTEQVQIAEAILLLAGSPTWSEHE